jgi:hypothetical protein
MSAEFVFNRREIPVVYEQLGRVYAGEWSFDPKEELTSDDIELDIYSHIAYYEYLIRKKEMEEEERNEPFE